MGISKTQGIVLKYTNLGEADKILTILTRSKGRIQAIAKGCRKPKSSLLASCELFVFSEFVFYKGTTFYHVTQAETRETFYNIRNDLMLLSYATYFAELAGTVSVEEMPAERLFLLLARALYYLSTKEIPAGIVNIAYQLRLMDISGYRPSLGRCVNCRRSFDEYERFSSTLGGVLCSDCTGADKSAFRLSKGTLEVFRTFLNTEISRLNNVKTDNTIYNELDRIIKDFVLKHLDKRFKSLDFLENLKNSGI